MKIQRPRLLKPLSSVALIAPSFRFDAELMRQGQTFLEKSYGIKTKLLDSVFDQNAYFAGQDERRLEELYSWLTDSETDAIFVIRGGYGCARIYPKLAAKLKKQKSLKPKIVAGHSDFTVVLNGLFQDFGWITFHAPVLVGRAMRDPLPIEAQTFRQSLFTSTPLGEISDPQMITIVPGEARGKMVGGNLCVIANAIGTNYEIETRDRILFLEDVTEAPYRIDRMLTQLLHSGKLNHIRGLVFGQMTDCKPSTYSPETDALAAVKLALEPFLRAKKIPTVFNFPAGHGSPQITFPIGCDVDVCADSLKPKVTFLKPGTKE